MIFLCTLFYNAWVEDVLDEKRDFLTYEKPASNEDLKQKIHAPFVNIPKLFEELHAEFENIMQGKKDFDRYFNEIIQIENLSQQKDIQAKYKMKYLNLHQNIVEFSNVLMSRQDDLDTVYQKVENIVEELKRTYPAESKKQIISSELNDVDNEYNLYIEWLFITVKNTAKILNDINLADIKFESKIDEELRLQTDIPGPQKITNFPMTKAPSVEAESIVEMQEEKEEEVDIWKEIEESDIKEDKKQSDKLYRSGNKLYKEKIYDKALNEYKESVKHNKKNIWAIAGISKVYIETKKYDNAISMINRAIEVFKTTRKKKM